MRRAASETLGPDSGPRSSPTTKLRRPNARGNQDADDIWERALIDLLVEASLRRPAHEVQAAA